MFVFTSVVLTSKLTATEAIIIIIIIIIINNLFDYPVQLLQRFVLSNDVISVVIIVVDYVKRQHVLGSHVTTCSCMLH